MVPCGVEVAEVKVDHPGLEHRASAELHPFGNGENTADAEVARTLHVAPRVVEPAQRAERRRTTQPDGDAVAVGVPSRAGEVGFGRVEVADGRRSARRPRRSVAGAHRARDLDIRTPRRRRQTDDQGAELRPVFRRDGARVGTQGSDRRVDVSLGQCGFDGSSHVLESGMRHQSPADVRRRPRVSRHARVRDPATA
jgi:hypothetical protein